MTPAERWVRDNARGIERAARDIRRRWRGPAGVEASDIAQEIRLGAILAGEKYQPERGTPFVRFVWWFALHKATRWYHAQRGAVRLSYHAPSRCDLRANETTRDELYEDGPVQAVEREPAEELGPEARAAVRELIEAAIAGCVRQRERRGVRAIVQAAGDSEQAVAELLDDPVFAGRWRGAKRRKIAVRTVARASALLADVRA